MFAGAPAPFVPTAIVGGFSELDSQNDNFSQFGESQSNDGPDLDQEFGEKPVRLNNDQAQREADLERRPQDSKGKTFQATPMPLSKMENMAFQQRPQEAQ